MSAQTFRFNTFNAFRSDTFARMRQAFAPRKPRHRIARIALGVVGVALLAMLVMFGLVAGAVMITGGLVYRLWKQRRKPIARGERVLDAEYRVVEPVSLPR